MAEFLIAGNVESVSFTHAERLCDILKQTLPCCSVTKHVALRAHWPAAREKLAAQLGFDPEQVRTLECIVWFADGRLVGGADAFSDYCKQTYNLRSDLELCDLPGIAKENAAVVKKLMDGAQDGQVLFDVTSADGLY